jgi:hypothetical protein
VTEFLFTSESVTEGHPDKIARETIRKIGYTDADLGFSADSCAVINAIDKQSPDIAQGVDSASDAVGHGQSDGALRDRRPGRRRGADRAPWAHPDKAAAQREAPRLDEAAEVAA